MTRWLIFIYSVLAFAAAVASLILFVLFLDGWSFMRWSEGEISTQGIATALGINVALIALFGVQHSGMARPGFKQVLTRFIPPAAERSTYVWLSALVLVAICLFWQPLPGRLWLVENEWARVALFAFQMGGWLLALVAALTIDALDLLGLRQAWRHLKGIDAPPPPEFTERGVYRFVRHPIQLGVLIGLWSAPTMTTSLLLLAAALTAYILIAIRLEERDLIATLGAEYEDYCRRVPMLFPARWPRSQRMPETRNSKHEIRNKH